MELETILGLVSIVLSLVALLAACTVYRTVLKETKKPTKHIWKETHRENLGSYMDYDVPHPSCICRMYRIGIHEKCILSGTQRLREVHDFFPVRNDETNR